MHMCRFVYDNHLVYPRLSECSQKPMSPVTFNVDTSHVHFTLIYDRDVNGGLLPTLLYPWGENGTFSEKLSNSGLAAPFRMAT